MDASLFALLSPAVFMIPTSSVAPCLAVALAASLWALPLAGQHADHTDHATYADLEPAEGTALTAEEVAALRAGAGMGLALPAELNGYPGPLHVLELADRLDLTPEQHRAVEAVREEMLTEARRLGEEVVGMERHLAGVFRSGNADAAAVRRITRHLGETRGALQAVHLEAHLTTLELLEPGQVEAYQVARGYASGD